MNAHKVTSTRDIKRANVERVYRVMNTLDAPATIPEISRRVPDLSTRTVRRAVADMARPSMGMVIEAGKRDGATMYTVRGKQFSATVMREQLIPYGDGYTDVHSFLDLMVNPGGNPIKLAEGTKQNILTDDAINAIRKRMAFIVVTAGSPGYGASVAKYMSGLEKIKRELEYVTNILASFTSSHVIYDNYRDTIAYELRRIEETDPELIANARAYVQDM